MTVGTFSVGELFPSSDQKQVSFLRFLISTRALVSLARSNQQYGEEAEGHLEELTFLMLLGLGAAYESANAFRHADSLGCFDALEAWLSQDDEAQYLKQDLALLRGDADRKDPESLVGRIVKFGRDKVGFHWSLDEIRDAAEDTSDTKVEAMVMGDSGNFLDTVIPVAYGVAHHVLRRRAGTQEALNELAGRVASFQGALFRVAEAAYSLLLRDHGFLDAPPSTPQ